MEESRDDSRNCQQQRPNQPYALLEGLIRCGCKLATVAAEEEAGQRRDQVRDALHRDLDDTADRAFRQYDAGDPANRLVAGKLEARWNKALSHVAQVEGKIASHNVNVPAANINPASLATLGRPQDRLNAPSTDARLKKHIVRTVIHGIPPVTVALRGEA